MTRFTHFAWAGILFGGAQMLLCADASQDRVTELVEDMRRLTFAGDQRAAGRLVPPLVEALAKPHPQAGLAWNQIGFYHAVQGNAVEAELAYLRGIRLVEAQPGNDRDTLALLLLNLGQLYLKAGGRAKQAEAILRRSVKLAEELYDSHSDELANFTYVLGVALNQAGNRSEARRHMERALLLVGQSTDGNIRRGIILANLAVLRAEEKQWNGARDTILQAIALLEQNLGAAHPDLVPVYLNLARIQEQLKQWDSASTALEKAREITETQLGPSHHYMVAILASSASVLRKTGRHSEAREQARRAKSITAALPRAAVGETWVHISDLRK